MKLLCIIGVLVAGVLFAVGCGGGDGDEPRDLPPGDEGEIQGVLLDYLKEREDRDSTELAALFSVSCGDRESDADAIIQRWQVFKDTFDVEIDSVVIESLEGDRAVVNPVGALLFEGEETAELASIPIDMSREDGAWRIATCGLVLPNTELE